MPSIFAQRGRGSRPSVLRRASAGSPFGRPRALLLATAILALAACTTPRGAGFQNEVLSAAGGRAGEPTTGAGFDPGFMVQAVTRAALPGLAAWPDAAGDERRWISASAGSRSAVIAPGDLLDLSIWDSSANSLLVPPGQRAVPLEGIVVDPSGRVFVPYLGEVQVSGLTPESARERIEAQLLDVVSSAQVQLGYRPGRANAVSLVGGVAAPGVVPLDGRDLTVLSLLSLGGGVSPDLRNPQLTLVRGDALFRTSVSRLFDEPTLDTTLRGGDKVLVEADDRYFLSLGASQAQAIHPFEQDRVTALDALSIIGGLDESRADPKGVLILREYPLRTVNPTDRPGPDRERVVFTIDLTAADGLFSAGAFSLTHGDLVYVTETPLTRTRTILGLVGSVFGTASRVQGFGS